ncbi:MAG: hypothetical protein IPH78_01315 [Bacteroidetes bacterium]|nr:hypothetical protein [Bacteroidota bacterium]
MLFFLLEFFCRSFLRIVPGVHTYSQWFKEVDTLVAYKGFLADSEGVFRAEPEASLYIQKHLAGQAEQLSPDLDNANREVYGLEHHYSILKTDSFNGLFAQRLRQILAKDSADRTALEKGIVDYSRCPINSDGFRKRHLIRAARLKRKRYCCWAILLPGGIVQLT